MKKIFALIAFTLICNISYSQKIKKQEIEKPSEGKSLVYILRTGAGPLINFRIYDKDKFLGTLNGAKHFVYECEPGQHLFWAASENRDFIEANLEPNAVYVLSAEGQMGAFVASVNFKPLNPNEFRDKRTFFQVIKQNSKKELGNSDEDKSESIAKGLEKYNELKQKESSKISVLDPSWKFENADKPIRD